MLWLGVDYYPEQWEESLLDEDLDRIVELGCNLIRIGEFAWHRMEPTEGQYDFSFFDRVIEKAKMRGLRVLFGTPTAAIPAWLAKKHPELLSESAPGVKRSFGGRHVCCYSSPVYYAYTEALLRQLAGHYREEDAIVAWQIDNELGHEGSDLCFCENCRVGFQRFLARRFDGEICRLNETYGTAFWSQEYNDFSELPLPAATVTTHNPALRLDFARYRAALLRDYAAFQASLLRELLPHPVLLHDFPGGGLYKHADYGAIAKTMDLAAYNNYPVWGGQKEPLPPHQIAFGLDYIRGLKQQNFWITEAILGAQGHDVTGYSPRPGQAKLWSMQGFAHGCEGLLYFRYRGATKGAEQFCYGVIDADNRKGRKFYEAQDCFTKIRPHAAALQTPIRSRVAILYDTDSLAAFRIQRQSLLLDVPEEMAKLYKPFYDRNIPADILPADAPFADYSLLLLPQMLLYKPEITARLHAFVQAGGTLVLTYRTAVKDADNNLVFGKPLPLGFSEAAGIRVAESESLQEGQEFPLLPTADGFVPGRGGIFREFLECDGDTEVLYRYGDPFYADYAAITRKKAGEGSVIYIGCGVEDAIWQSLSERLLRELSIPFEETPDGVELCYRGEGEHRIRMLLNHNAFPIDWNGISLHPFECRIEPVG